MKAKKWMIGGAIILTLAGIGSVLPQEEEQQIQQVTQVEKKSAKPTEQQFNDKYEYWEFHTKQRMNNILSTDLNVIQQELDLCNVFISELRQYTADNELTQAQSDSINTLNDELLELRLTYQNNKKDVEGK